MLEKLFQLKAHNTNVRTEILAGITTFLTMAYILFVNPSILGETGMDKGAVFVATCLAAAIGSSIMGLIANYPIALAPGMGLNAFFTYTVVLHMGHTWQVALGAVFLSACMFFIISIFRIREWIINSIPLALRSAIAAGIGFPLNQAISLPNISMLFLAAVLFSAMRYGLWPSLFTSLLSMLAYNVLFLPPLFTVTISDPSNVVALFFFLVVAIFTSQLAARVRLEAKASRQRADSTAALYAFSRKIAGIGGRGRTAACAVHSPQRQGKSPWACWESCSERSRVMKRQRPRHTTTRTKQAKQASLCSIICFT